MSSAEPSNLPNPPEYSSLPTKGSAFNDQSHTSTTTKSIPSTLEPNRAVKSNSSAPVPPKQLNKKRYVKAVYDFKSEDSEDLAFKMGDLIEVIDSSDQYGWWVGTDSKGKKGNFPSNYVMEQ